MSFFTKGLKMMRRGAPSARTFPSISRRHAHFSVNNQTNEVRLLGPTKGNSGGLGPNAHDKHVISFETVGGGTPSAKSLAKMAVLQHQYRNQKYSPAKMNTSFFFPNGLPNGISTENGLSFDMSKVTQRTTVAGKNGFKTIQQPKRTHVIFREIGGGDHHLES